MQTMRKKVTDEDLEKIILLNSDESQNRIQQKLDQVRGHGEDFREVNSTFIKK